MTELSPFAALALVTGRELRERGRTRSYLLSGAITLLLVAALILLPVLLDDPDVTYEVGTLGEGGAELLSAAEALATQRLDEGGALTFDVTAFASEDEARAALAEDDVELVLVDGESILRQGTAGFSGSDLQDLLQEAAAIAQLEGTDVEAVADLLGGQPLPVSTVRGAADEGLETARSLIAYGGMFLLYMAILTYGQWTLMGVTEEKTSRVVEVLLATVKPWQLLAGKILGIGLLGLAQFAVTVVTALVLIRVTGVLELPVIPVDSAIALPLWFILGYGLYSTMFATAGALVGRLEDAQSVASPIALVAVAGFIASFQVLDDPSGVVAQVMTYIPVVAPFVVPVRIAYQEIAVWEQVLAVAVTVGTLVVLVRIAARIYAGGLLHFGSKMGWRQAWRRAAS